MPSFTETIPDCAPALSEMQPMMSQYPLGFGRRLQALAYGLSKPREIAIVGDPDFTEAQTSLRVMEEGYRPFQLGALGATEPNKATVPRLADRGLVEGQPAMYLCRDFAYQASMTEPQAPRTLLTI